MSNQICCYCLLVWSVDAVSCSRCKEYKGLMPLNLETLKYLGEHPEDWTEYLD